MILELFEGALCYKVRFWGNFWKRFFLMVEIRFFRIKTTFSKSKSLQHVQKIRPSFFKDAGVLFMINAQFSRLRFWSRRWLFLIPETFYFRGGLFFHFHDRPLRFFRQAFLKIEEHTNDQDFIFRRPLFYFLFRLSAPSKKIKVKINTNF